MSSDEQAFEKAIREAPGDPAPMLRYAEWLAETGAGIDTAIKARSVREAHQSRMPKGAWSPDYPAWNVRWSELCHLIDSLEPNLPDYWQEGR